MDPFYSFLYLIIAVTLNMLFTLLNSLHYKMLAL